MVQHAGIGHELVLVLDVPVPQVKDEVVDALPTVSFRTKPCWFLQNVFLRGSRMQVLMFPWIRSFLRERVQRGAGEVRALPSGSPPECFSESITNTVVDAPLGFHVSQQRAQPRPFEARALSAGSPLEHVSERIMYSVVDVPPCARVSGCAEQVEQARSS